MSSIGAYSFIRMVGPQLSALRPTIELIDRMGIDGTAVTVPSEKAAGTVVQTVEGYTLLANANVAKSNYELLIGSFVTVIDDLGLTVTNVLVENVTDVRVQAVISSTNASINYIVMATWQLKESS